MNVYILIFVPSMKWLCDSVKIHFTFKSTHVNLTQQYLFDLISTTHRNQWIFSSFSKCSKCSKTTKKNRFFLIRQIWKLHWYVHWFDINVGHILCIHDSIRLVQIDNDRNMRSRRRKRKGNRREFIEIAIENHRQNSILWKRIKRKMHFRFTCAPDSAFIPFTFEMKTTRLTAAHNFLYLLFSCSIYYHIHFHCARADMRPFFFFLKLTLSMDYLCVCARFKFEYI